MKFFGRVLGLTSDSSDSLRHLNVILQEWNHSIFVWCIELVHGKSFFFLYLFLDRTDVVSNDTKGLCLKLEAATLNSECTEIFIQLI